MVSYLHHVPRRLRLCLASLKRNEPAAEPLRLELLSIQGVNSVSVNLVTGSVIIQYDRNSFEPQTIWTALRRLGYVHQAPMQALHPAVKTNNDASSNAREVGLMVASAIMKALVDAALERCFGRAAGTMLRLLV